MADQVSPSQFSPKTNGVHANGAPPAPKAEAPITAPDPVSEAKKFRDEAASLKDAAEKRARVHEIERRKFADEKKGLGAKLTEHGQFQKEIAEFKRLIANAELDPEPFLRKFLGETWYDKAVGIKIGGGAPTAGAVALSKQETKEEVIAEFKKELAERDAKAEAAENARVADELKHFTSQAAEFAKTNADEYPRTMVHFGDEGRAASAVMQWIEAEFGRTGKSPSFKQAMEGFEAHLDKVAAATKKLTGKEIPANTSAVGGAPVVGSRSGSERRTLSNDLTATTPGQKRQPRNDDERREAAFAAYEAARRKA